MLCESNMPEVLVGERGEEEVVRKAVVFAVRTLGDNAGRVDHSYLGLR